MSDSPTEDLLEQKLQETEQRMNRIEYRNVIRRVASRIIGATDSSVDIRPANLENINNILQLGLA